MACAARFGQVVGGPTRPPLPWERVGARGSRIGSWRAPCSKRTCSRPMNQEFRGARRPPLRQAGRPPLRMRGSWESAPGRGAGTSPPQSRPTSNLTMRQAEPGKGRSPLATSRLLHRPIRGGFPCLPFYRWLQRRAALPPAHLLSPSGTPRMANLQGIPLGFSRGASDARSATL